MDELEQNQVIAAELTARGGINFYDFYAEVMVYKPTGLLQRTQPLFTRNLDSCRLFESALQHEEKLEYADALITVLQAQGEIKCEELYEREGYPEDPRAPLAALLMATPAQRCEAFLKTIDQWNCDERNT